MVFDFAQIAIAGRHDQIRKLCVDLERILCNAYWWYPRASVRSSPKIERKNIAVLLLLDSYVYGVALTNQGHSE